MSSASDYFDRRHAELIAELATEWKPDMDDECSHSSMYPMYRVGTEEVLAYACQDCAFTERE